MKQCFGSYLDMPGMKAVVYTHCLLTGQVLRKKAQMTLSKATSVWKKQVHGTLTRPNNLVPHANVLETGI